MSQWYLMTAINPQAPLAYTVHVEFADVAVAQEYVAWLEHGHLQQVLDGGADRVTLVQLDETHLEVRYRFPSAEAFAAYEKGPAVALRADSAARFPAGRGVTARRSTGRVVRVLGVR